MLVSRLHSAILLERFLGTIVTDAQLWNKVSEGNRAEGKKQGYFTQYTKSQVSSLYAPRLSPRVRSNPTNPKHLLRFTIDRGELLRFTKVPRQWKNAKNFGGGHRCILFAIRKTPDHNNCAHIERLLLLCTRTVSSSR